ncbi:MFS general substrate transporter [Lojkania enalia]|uniref:MFS general substrate transporter n=1 Tax=Lojkania enalia TaxID=147567 RepID=A0A9P4N1Z0_9PLEO|nr:MFS general substrate transporter [Didymosphaeria enalia]
MRSNIRFFNIRHQFDPEQYRDNRIPTSSAQITRADCSKRPLTTYSNGQPFEDWYRAKHIAKKAIASSHAPLAVVPEEEPYHVFSHRRKWVITVIVGIYGLFPAISPNIYLPALAKVSEDLNIIQGAAALFWGPLSDSFGRRPIYIYSMIILIAANITLSFSPNFPVLLIFRGIQAAGIASTVSIGSAVIQDISTPSERDTFYSFYQGIRNLAVVLAPIIGGLFSNFLDFRSIFIFLLGISLATFLVLVTFLPETLRSIAGNGSVRLNGIHRPLAYKLKVFVPPEGIDESKNVDPRPRVSARQFLQPLLMLQEKEVVLGLVFGSAIFAVWSMVTVSTVELFKRVFYLNELLIGLAFIPSGLGSIAGSMLIGSLLNRDFLAASSRYKASHSIPPSTLVPRNPFPVDFPIEHTRLARLPFVLSLFLIALCFYGFTLSVPEWYNMDCWIILPLILQFLIAAMANAAFGIHQTLISDLYPTDSASSAAACQLIRCMFSAIGVAVVQPMIDGIAAGPTFVALGLVVMVLVPLPVAQWYWGEQWRKERLDRENNDTIDRSEKV